MRYLAVVLFTALIVPFTPIVFGPPDFSDQEKFNAADVILTGKIISFSQPNPPPNMLSSLDTIYEIQVDKYVKNPLSQDIISVIAKGGPNAEMGPRIGNVDFDVGDIVYLFLRGDDDGELYRVSTFTSYRIETTCDPIPDELLHLTDEPSSWEFQTIDSEFNEKQIFAVNEEIIIRFDVTNAKPTTRTLTYDLTIHDGERKDDRTTFHTESKDITLPACVGHAILEWHFTPTQEIDYFVDIRNDGRGTGFGFPVTSDGSTPSNYYDQPTVEYSVLKQHKMKIPDDQLMCKRDGAVLAFRNNDKPACLMPDTLAKLLERGWIGKKSYEPTPNLNLFGKASSSEIAFDAAQKFIDSSKTVTFDDSERSGGFSNLSNKMVNSTSVYLLEGDFTTNTSGYGNRANQEYFETQTHHNIVVKIEDSNVVYAVIDNQWDEINQEFVAKRSENFKDFEVRYQKLFGQEGKDHHIQLESKPGLMRITTTPDDTFYLVEHSEFEKFWSIVIENKFFDTTQSVQYCETCISYSLKIESGGTHNTVLWNDGDVLDERLRNIISSLDTISQNQDDGWAT